MANIVINQINDELIALKVQLNKFTDTVNYLSNAKHDVENAVNVVNTAEQFLNTKVEELKNTHDSFLKLSDAIENIIQKIDSVDFPERLSSIEKNIKETLLVLNETKESTLNELKIASEVINKVDFDGKFKVLQILIDSSNTTNNDLVNSIKDQQIPEKIELFEHSVNKRLHESLKEVQKKNEESAINITRIITDLNLPIKIDRLDLSISGLMTVIQGIQGRLDLLDRNISDKIRDLHEYQKSNIESTLIVFSKKQKSINYLIILLGLINFLLLIYFLIKK